MRAPVGTSATGGSSGRPVSSSTSSNDSTRPGDASLATTSRRPSGVHWTQVGESTGTSARLAPTVDPSQRWRDT
ncbi:hypothetical protein [Phycicoccus ginsengisoli]